MREATPYVKKGSPVSEIGWETPPPESPRIGSPPISSSSSSSSDPPSSPTQPSLSLQGDRRCIPLKMCCVTRAMTTPDPENSVFSVVRLNQYSPICIAFPSFTLPVTRLIFAFFSHTTIPCVSVSCCSSTLCMCTIQLELHSPDARHTVVLRCPDQPSALSWFSAMHSVTSTLAQTESEKQSWRPVLVAVTEKDLLLYDSLPRGAEAWQGPAHAYPLLATRLVHSGPDRGSPHSGTELFFATRTGTRLGIETHLFRAETTKDLSLWTRHIVNGCHAAAEMIREVSTSCLYRGRECRLVIHYEQGFSVLADPKLADGENGEEGAAHTPSRPTVLLSYPYEKLKMSSDDGVRMLSLDFGGKEGEIQTRSVYFTVSDVACCQGFYLCLQMTEEKKGKNCEFWKIIMEITGLNVESEQQWDFYDCCIG
ncbi:hypothetical protein F2P81_001751 [Scophthalmus maximus]|uniref:PH domain-containing protein n=1 Tax=Scophthalmus maximus TaxID=52904 RepID=A0A6A4TT23_SCOMX|nr:hypothetical protein F2P81_001751 [Scophthalmus maximus]